MYNTPRQVFQAQSDPLSEEAQTNRIKKTNLEFFRKFSWSLFSDLLLHSLISIIAYALNSLLMYYLKISLKQLLSTEWFHKMSGKQILYFYILKKSVLFITRLNVSTSLFIFTVIFKFFKIFQIISRIVQQNFIMFKQLSLLVSPKLFMYDIIQ